MYKLIAYGAVYLALLSYAIYACCTTPKRACSYVLAPISVLSMLLLGVFGWELWLAGDRAVRHPLAVNRTGRHVIETDLGGRPRHILGEVVYRNGKAVPLDVYGTLKWKVTTNGKHVHVHDDACGCIPKADLFRVGQHVGVLAAEYEVPLDLRELMVGSALVIRNASTARGAENVFALTLAIGGLLVLLLTSTAPFLKHWRASE